LTLDQNADASHGNEGIEDEEEQLSRVILFEDITDYLFSLSSAEARLSLVLQFIDFFGGPVSQRLACRLPFVRCLYLFLCYFCVLALEFR